MRSWQKDALAYAREQAPREMIGLVVDGKFFRCRNIHPYPRNSFEIAPADYRAAAAAGKIEAVVHSHVNCSANPSVADLDECEKGTIPWYIVGLPSGTWKELRPCGYTLPLEGRPYIEEMVDCYSIVRDGMRELFGVALPDFRRPAGWWQDHRPEDLYRENYERAGYVLEVDRDELQPGDLIVMALGSSKPSHGGLYLGGGRMLHHPPGQLSGKTRYAGYYRDITVECMRHRELLDA